MPSNCEKFSHALNIVCQSPCLWLGDYLDFCKPPVVKDDGECELWTWMPEDAEWVYLIKVVGFTLAYLPSTDTVYFVNPAYALNNTCPANVVMACQCIRDPNCSPRLLVVDLLSPCESLTAPQRYAKLQQMQEHFRDNVIALQWCGEKGAITDEFLAGLPHRTSARLGVGAAAGEFAVEFIL